MIKVIAKETGFYEGRRIRPGEAFNITEKSHFSKRWMTEYSEEKKTPDEPKEKTPRSTGSKQVI